MATGNPSAVLGEAANAVGAGTEAGQLLNVGATNVDGLAGAVTSGNPEGLATQGMQTAGSVASVEGNAALASGLNEGAATSGTAVNALGSGNVAAGLENGA